MSKSKKISVICKKSLYILRILCYNISVGKIENLTKQSVKGVGKKKMLIRVKESNKIYSIGIYGWKNNQWSPDMADDVLTDMWMLEHQTEDFRTGYTLTQAEFDKFCETIKSDEEEYNNGSTTVEWLERNEDYPQQDFKNIDVRIEYTYTYED